MTDVNWRDVLSPELVRQIEREIERQFAEGWHACKRAVMRLEPTRSAEEIAPAPGEAEVRGYPTERAPRGFWADLLDQELRERFPHELKLSHGMTAVQARTDEFKLARSSYNVAIQTLEAAGKLRRDGKKLIWTPPADDADKAGAARSEAAETDEDETRSASAISPLLRRLDDAAA